MHKQSRHTYSNSSNRMLLHPVGRTALLFLSTVCSTHPSAPGYWLLIPLDGQSNQSNCKCWAGCRPRLSACLWSDPGTLPVAVNSHADVHTETMPTSNTVCSAFLPTSGCLVVTCMKRIGGFCLTREGQPYAYILEARISSFRRQRWRACCYQLMQPSQSRTDSL